MVMDNMEGSGPEDPQGAAKDTGQARLEELGYKQELNRRLGLVSSVASSFATMAFMMGITGQRNSVRCSPSSARSSTFQSWTVLLPPSPAAASSLCAANVPVTQQYQL